MPSYDVTSPDGRKFRVNAPDGATQDEVLAYARANMPAAPEAPKAEDPGILKTLLIAAGRTGDKIAQGYKQASLSIPPGPFSPPVPDSMRATAEQELAAQKEQQKGADEVYAPLAAMHPVATTVGEALPYIAATNPAVMAGLAGMEYGTPGVRAVKAGTSYAAGKAGEWLGGKIAGSLQKNAASNTASLAAQKAQNAVRDATTREAQQAGYVIPPTQVSPEAPGIVNRVLEGISGKIQTAQAAAIKNQEVTNQLAKKALLLPQDAPLTRESIGAVRSAAGEVYKAVKGFGPVQADDEFRAAIGSVAGDYRALVNEFPSQANGSVNALLGDLSRDNFNSSTMVEFVKRLRHDGFKNIISPDPEKVALGRIQVGAQNALEDLLERRVAATGDAGALDVFRNARALIAKSYTVQKALDEASGKVVAAKIGKEFTKGRPLTGDLATIGKVAQMFPKAVQDVKSSMPGLSPLDAMFGAGAAVSSGNPLAAALPLARPLIRQGLLSGPYQRAMVNAPDYGQSLAQRLLAKGGQNPELLQRFGGLLGLTGAQTF